MSSPPRASFNCGCISSNIPRFYEGGSSVVSNQDGTKAWTFPIPCCQCSRRKAKTEEESLKAQYTLRIEEMRAQIKRAEDRIWKGPPDELLIEAKDERVKAANGLEYEMQEKVASVWKVFEKRWG